MGRYLNSSTSYVLYKGQTEQPYFVDKSQMLSELFPFLDSGNTHICITRPRRFGKTVMANMITAFLGKKQDSDSIFKSLKISQNDLYSKYRNQYNVISIDFSKMPRDCDSYTDYIDRIETNLIRDLRKEYPQIEIYEDDSAADVLETIFEECDQQRFVFVLDEWDFIFHKDFVTEENKKQYVLFLSNLLKDRSYVQLTYMTGILPIAKYSSGSELNMFWEYTMASEAKYNEYFGFTDSEVDQLYEKYTRNTREIHISREDLKEWYDGYHFGSVDVYCPWDVMNYALNYCQEGKKEPVSYWKNTSGNEIIRSFIDYAGSNITRKLETLLAGNSIEQKIEENLTYDYLHSSEENLWSILYLTGYLTKAQEESQNSLETERTALVIPNLEVKEIYQNTILKWFDDSVKGWERKKLFQAVWDGNEELLSAEMTKLLRKTISYHDYKEDFYHAFLLGIFAGAGYSVESNKEHGEGRSDVVVHDVEQGRVAVFEVKYAKTLNDMSSQCAKALKQIQDKMYAKDYEDEYEEIDCYGISFYKKRCKIRRL
jgi:hypothetical protein